MRADRTGFNSDPKEFLLHRIPFKSRVDLFRETAVQRLHHEFAWCKTIRGSVLESVRHPEIDDGRCSEFASELLSYFPAGNPMIYPEFPDPRVRMRQRKIVIQFVMSVKCRCDIQPDLFRFGLDLKCLYRFSTY